jgi:2-polyprenyl-6-hydroxyphenyl methylase/3-demethylubiquinone-9 3-methyltransferase
LPELRGVVADIGGGKKPFLSSAEVSGITYVGIDIDRSELESAPPGRYHTIHVCDIEEPPAHLLQAFDVVICRNTLEHVRSAEMALQGIFAMLKSGGTCIGVVPCQHALFSKLNRRLPEKLKRRLLFSLFPGKSGDGFPAYYDRACPVKYEEMIRACGGRDVWIERYFWSAYFTFLVPVYLGWRVITAFQLLRRGYCEKFHFGFKRPEPGREDP